MLIVEAPLSSLRTLLWHLALALALAVLVLLALTIAPGDSATQASPFGAEIVSHDPGPRP